MPEHSLTERLAQHLMRPIGPDNRERARLHLLDWMGCVAGARCSDAAAVAPSGAIERAAFIGNVLEMDDVHRRALLHPGPVVWPAALAGATTIDAMLDAAIRGYEAMITVGATFDEHHYAHYHPTATAGVFGAAAVSADTATLAHALALAGSVSGGVWQTRHSANQAKQWHVAHAIATGRSAADHARRGVTGPLDVLEGVQGIYAATCTAPKPMVLGEGWRIDEVSFKPWAACRHAHPAIDAALELRAAGKLTPPFHVATYADAITFCDRPDPASELDAKFSLQHAVAVIADGRDAEPADFTPDAIAALAPLRAQVTVTEDAAITARYPAHFGARVNGFALTDTRGDPERPLSRDGVIAKARTLFAWGRLDPTQAERGVTLALDGDDVDGLIGWLEEVV